MANNLVEKVNALFSYSDGQLIRKKSSGGKKKGTVAGNKHRTGYWQVRIGGRLYQRSHVVWALHKGYFPKEIDHIDQDKDNDRIENLREATRRENCCNRKKWRGEGKYKGVYPSNNGLKFVAQIRHKGKLYHLGTFDTEDLAKEAYDKKCIEFFKEYAKPNG